MTPSSDTPKAGSGSDTAATFRDSGGAPLDGARTYTLTLPPAVPAAYFWSITIYDNQTRSMLQQTDQRFPSVILGQRRLRPNDDGSITLWFGPKGPRDRSSRANWIQTLPGKGWNAVFRLYGPQQEWIDQTWAPNDIARVSEPPGRAVDEATEDANRNPGVGPNTGLGADAHRRPSLRRRVPNRRHRRTAL